MKYSELKRILKAAKCTVVREGKDHTIWHSPITESNFPVPRHSSQDVKPGTLNSIMQAAGLK